MDPQAIPGAALKVGEVDLAGIATYLIVEFGLKGLLAIVVSVMILAAFWGFTRQRGWWATPSDKMSRDILLGQQDLRRDFLQAIERIIDLNEQMLRGQESKLTVDQVDAVVEDKFKVYQFRLLDSILEMYRHNHIEGRRDESISQLKDIFRTVIVEEDSKLFRLPGILGAMIPAQEKLATLEEATLSAKIYDLMIQSPSNDPANERVVYRRARQLLNDIMVQQWRIR